MMPTSSELEVPGKHTLVGPSEILRTLVLKELKIKYKRSILGFLWSLVTPALLTGVYLFVFIHVYKVPKKDFVLFLMTGLLPFQYFNLAALAGTNSLVENARVIRKVYFPRVLIPVASVMANLVNFVLGLGLLLLVLLFSGRPIWQTIHWLILAILLETAVCCGAVLALSAWNVFLRDIRQLISILMTILFFATPIVYELDLVPSAFRPILLANPLTSIMEIYRAALFEVTNPEFGLMFLGMVEAAALLAFGYFIFRRVAPNLAKEL